MDERKRYDRDDDTLETGAFVYCLQHMRVHNTGLCTVSNLDKIPLFSQDASEAQEEWRRKKLMIESFLPLKREPLT